MYTRLPTWNISTGSEVNQTRQFHVRCTSTHFIGLMFTYTLRTRIHAYRCEARLVTRVPHDLSRDTLTPPRAQMLKVSEQTKY